MKAFYKGINKQRNGFTIVELLIVIVVISILAAITIVAYNGVQMRGRDSIRLAEMSRLQKQIELYYIENGSYPQCGGASVCATTPGYAENLLTLPLSPAPKKDPLNVNGTYGYYYARAHTKAPTGSPVSTGDSNDYVLAMQLEQGGGSVFSGWNSTTLNWYKSVDN